jgi:hypothetical protein
MVADFESLFDRLQLAGPDMLLDGYDQYNQQESDVVNITPDDASEEPSDTLPRANDCMGHPACFFASSLTFAQSRP